MSEDPGNSTAAFVSVALLGILLLFVASWTIIVAIKDCGIMGGSCNSPDKGPLESLYDDTDGPNWNYGGESSHSSRWKNPQEKIGKWYGVTTKDGWFGSIFEHGYANRDRVTELDLSNNGLRGEIPLALGDLNSLKVLRIGGNELSGCIPDSLQSQLNQERSDLGSLPYCEPVSRR